jgi:hypothetical protein
VDGTDGTDKEYPRQMMMMKKKKKKEREMERTTLVPKKRVHVRCCSVV